MNSLKLMNTSALPEEIAAKARKEQEYQAQLRDQIEEKKRKKEDEERKAEDTKKRELEEYLRVHYKGKIPEYVLEKLPSKGGKARHSDHRDNDESIYTVGHRASAFEEDYDVEVGGGRGGGGPKGLPPRLGRRSQPDEEEELTLELDGDEYDGRGRSGPKRRGDRDGGGGKSKWVSQTEYDELSALCDRLLAQQDSLQSELRNQAKIIKVRSGWRMCSFRAVLLF